MSGTLSLSWGKSGGFYLHRHRVCLGRLAFTLVPDVEIDELMRDHVEVPVLHADALLALRMAFADGDPHGTDWTERATRLWAEVRDE